MKQPWNHPPLVPHDLIFVRRGGAGLELELQQMCLLWEILVRPAGQLESWVPAQTRGQGSAGAVMAGWGPLGCPELHLQWAPGAASPQEHLCDLKPVDEN